MSTRTHQSPRSRQFAWQPTNRDEICTFFVLIIWMGLLQAGSIEDYWRKSILYQTAMTEKMSCNRFQLLLSCLHFSNNEESLPLNRLAKIATVLDLMNENFQSLYKPGEEVMIDDTLIP